MSKPAKIHMAAAKHLLRYLKGSLDLNIKYTTGNYIATKYLSRRTINSSLASSRNFRPVGVFYSLRGRFTYIYIYCQHLHYLRVRSTPSVIITSRSAYSRLPYQGQLYESAADVLSRYLVPALCNQARLVRLICLHLNNPLGANDLLAWRNC